MLVQSALLQSISVKGGGVTLYCSSYVGPVSSITVHQCEGGILSCYYVGPYSSITVHQCEEAYRVNIPLTVQYVQLYSQFSPEEITASQYYCHLDIIIAGKYVQQSSRQHININIFNSVHNKSVTAFVINSAREWQVKMRPKTWQNKNHLATNPGVMQTLTVHMLQKEE